MAIQRVLFLGEIWKPSYSFHVCHSIHIVSVFGIRYHMHLHNHTFEYHKYTLQSFYYHTHGRVGYKYQALFKLHCYNCPFIPVPYINETLIPPAPTGYLHNVTPVNHVWMNVRLYKWTSKSLFGVNRNSPSCTCILNVDGNSILQCLCFLNIICICTFKCKSVWCIYIMYTYYTQCICWYISGVKACTIYILVSWTALGLWTIGCENVEGLFTFLRPTILFH